MFLRDAIEIYGRLSIDVSENNGVRSVYLLFAHIVYRTDKHKDNN